MDEEGNTYPERHYPMKTASPTVTTATTTAPDTPDSDDVDLRWLPRMISVSQASEMLGLSVWDTRMLIVRGELPATKVGRRKEGPEPIWIHPNDVAKYISDREYLAQFEHIADDQLCTEHIRQFGARRARAMADMMIRATGSGCPCTRGEVCLFVPSPR